MNARQQYLINEEAEQVKNALGAFPGSERRCIAAVARRILLGGPYFYNGNRIDPVAKPLGAGVWKITNNEAQK
jgi:hypothetical protein